MVSNNKNSVMREKIEAAVFGLQDQGHLKSGSPAV